MLIPNSSNLNHQYLDNNNSKQEEYLEIILQLMPNNNLSKIIKPLKGEDYLANNNRVIIAGEFLDNNNSLSNNNNNSKINNNREVVF